jgi:hypothetical protein
MKYLFKKSFLFLSFVFLFSFTVSEPKASIPGGVATVSVSPQNGTFTIGNNIEMDVNFNTNGETVSGIAVQLVFPYTGLTPEVGVQKISIGEILSAGDWTCPTQNFRTDGANVIIDIGCANTSSSGYTASGETKLATITFFVQKVPSTNPITIRFDSENSVITRKSDNQDILLVSDSFATYFIENLIPTSTPTPTIILTPTPIFTPTPTILPNQSASLFFDKVQNQSVTKGNVFSVDIYVDAQKGATGVDAFISYDKGLLRFTGVDYFNGNMGGIYDWDGGILLVQRNFSPVLGKTKIATLVFETLKTGNTEAIFVNDRSFYSSKIYNGASGNILDNVNSMQVKVNGKFDFNPIIKILIRKF